MAWDNNKVFGKNWVPSPKKRVCGFKTSGKKKVPTISQFKVREALATLAQLVNHSGPLYAYHYRYFTFSSNYIGGSWEAEVTNMAMDYHGNSYSDEVGQRSLILLIAIINRLGGIIAIPMEATEEAYADTLSVIQGLERREWLISTKTGNINGQKALRISHGVELKGAVTIDVELAIKAMLLQNGVGPKTLARVERKYFEQASLMNLVVDQDQEFDEYVYLSLEKKDV